MPASSQTGSPFAASNLEDARPARTSEDRVYQAVTVVAILVFLASLWVF